jgi:hypothetical protein
VDDALENEAALRRLEFLPLLTPYWKTRTKEQKLPHAPPVHCIFGYTSDTKDFGTFNSWFSGLPTSLPSDGEFPYHPSFNHFIVCSLDKGLIFCRGDGDIPRWLTIAEEKYDRNLPVVAEGQTVEVDPAKTLFLFLGTLWTMLEQSPRHPGFDIRSYMDRDLGTLISFNHEGKIAR